MSKLFPITLEVEESSLGPVLRTLNGMPGIAKLHLDLDMAPRKGAAKPLKQPPFRQPRGPDTPRQKDIVIQFLLEGPKSLAEVGDLLAAHGFAKSAPNGVLNQLRRAGVTESGGVGIHQLTEKARRELARALPRPTEKKAAEKVAKSGKEAVNGNHPSRARPAIPATQIILSKLEGAAEPVKRSVLVEAIVANGQSGRTIDGAVGKLKEQKLITAPEVGHYELSAKGRAHMEKLKANGEIHG